MRRFYMQLLRTIVTLMVMGTMAVMIFSQRTEINELKAAKRAATGEKPGVYVLCRFDLKPDTDIADYIARTMSIVPTVRAEAGCQLYTLVGDVKTDWEKPMRFGERTLWAIEKWDSLEALKAHLETPHMKAFGPTVRNLRSASTFHVLEAVK